MDAQCWGVPQRRKRISLVLDLTGERAGEVLFEPESLRGHFTPLRAAGKATPGTVEASTVGTNQIPSLSYTLKIRSGCEGGGKGALVQTEKSATLSTLQDQTVFCIAGNIIDRSDNSGANGIGVKENVSYTLNTADRSAVAMPTPVLNDQGGAVMSVSYDVTGTLRAQEHGHQPVVFNTTNTVIKWIVRRLTPTECERLQGYPDDWTNIGEWVDSKGKVHKDADTPRYKALGNSIALPQWYYVLGGISDRLPENATLGSLFDGIGGFPKVWADLHDGNKRLCVWASEIEEFPIAVTRKHFPEE